MADLAFYVVSESATYYPEPAAEDWLSVHLDEAEARAAFDGRPAASFATVFLIEVTPPTWRLLAEK